MNQLKGKLSFGRDKRIVKSNEFREVFDQGRVQADHCLVVHARRASTGETKLGLSISKRVGNSPQRNRWKRLIRESFRLQFHDLPKGLMIVVRPRRGATPDFSQVRSSLLRLIRRLDRDLGEQK